MELTTTHALKEWNVAVDALSAGKTIMLLRKGGISEEGGAFKVASDRVLLYPTYEHQQPDLLKSEYATLVTPVVSGWHPETVKISAYAQITDILLVSESKTVEALLPYHIWNQQFVSDRLKWKSRQPLYILLLRTYKLAQTYIIPYSSQYSGCKSWIDLLAEISLADALPALSDIEYEKKVLEIRAQV